MSEYQDQMAQRHTLDRIATALERIADSLEAKVESAEAPEADGPAEGQDYITLLDGSRVGL